MEKILKVSDIINESYIIDIKADTKEGALNELLDVISKNNRITDNKMYRKAITYLKIFAVVLVQLAIIVRMNAQTEESADKNHNEQVTIVGSFDPKINEAFKIYQKPSTRPISFVNPSFEFNHIDKQSATQISLEPITPANVNVDKRE